MYLSGLLWRFISLKAQMLHIKNVIVRISIFSCLFMFSKQNTATWFNTQDFLFCFKFWNAGFLYKSNLYIRGPAWICDFNSWEWNVHMNSSHKYPQNSHSFSKFIVDLYNKEKGNSLIEGAILTSYFACSFLPTAIPQITLKSHFGGLGNPWDVA